MLMGTHDDCIEHHELIVGVPRQHFENTHRHAPFPPSAMAPVRRFPVAVTLGQIDHGMFVRFVLKDVGHNAPLGNTDLA